MRIKRIFGLFTLCGCLYSIASAQSELNSIYKFNGFNSILTESIWIDDSLFIAGSNFTNGGRTGLIAKFSKDGSFLYSNNLIDTFTDYGLSFWDKGMSYFEDTIYHIASKGYIGSQHSGVILKLNRSGSILSEKEFNSIYFPEDDFTRFKDFIKTKSGFYIVDYARKTESDFQSCLLKIDNDLNEKWRKCYGNISLEIPKDLIITSKEKLITLANSTNLDISESYIGPGNGYYKGYIFQTDSSGVLNWEWRSESKMEAIYAGHLEDDSTLVVAAGRGKEVCSDSQSNALCFIRWTGGVFKFNLLTRTKIWDTSLSGGAHTTMFDNRYLDIIPSIEKDGYILCGAGYDTIRPCRIDTVDKCWSNPGVIAKISNLGDSLWLRKFFGVIDIYESNILYDAEIAPDSGYSFVGEAFNPWPGETQGQHGWILITDKYGCLVPGCQLTSSIENDADAIAKDPLMIYPNPATDLLNIFIARDLKPNATIHLFDTSGKELDTWNTFEKGATYIIPTGKFLPGVYVLSLQEDNKVIYSQQVIIYN